MAKPTTRPAAKPVAPTPPAAPAPAPTSDPASFTLDLADLDNTLAKLTEQPAGQAAPPVVQAEQPDDGAKDPGPEVIKEGDPEGRQPGLSTDPIEVPKAVLEHDAPPPATGILLTDGEPDIQALIAAEQEKRKAAGLPPVLPAMDAKRVAEMAVGQAAVGAKTGPVAPQPEVVEPPVPFTPPAPPPKPNEPPPISAATLAEIEAGKQALARKTAEMERTKQLVAQHELRAKTA